MKRASDGEVIPGGRALAKYVARRAVVYQKLHYERIRAKLERQQTALRKEFDERGSGHPYDKRTALQHSTMPCAGCWFVFSKADLVVCQGSSAHGSYCEECRFEGFCRTDCAVQCEASGCGKWMVCHSKYPGCYECDECSEYVCGEHKIFCRYCGYALCDRPDTQCEREHACDAKAKKVGRLEEAKTE